MKKINQLFFVKIITILFIAITFQSCSTQSENSTKYETPEESIKPSNTTQNTDVATQEELEQTAELLLLATISDEIDNTNNQTFDSDENNTDYENKDNNEASEMIHDRVETELSTNIVYE